MHDFVTILKYQRPAADELHELPCCGGNEQMYARVGQQRLTMFEPLETAVHSCVPGQLLADEQTLK